MENGAVDVSDSSPRTTGGHTGLLTRVISEGGRGKGGEGEMKGVRERERERERKGEREGGREGEERGRGEGEMG